MDKPKILVIDDDEALCESIVDIIEMEAYSIEASHTAADGLKKVESDFCNIVLLDMRLPDSEGLTVLDELKKISPDTEVIVFTAFAQMETVIRAMDKGAFSFIPKPFEMPYMLTIIKRALQKQAMILQNRILYQQTIEEEREWEETFDSISDMITIQDKDFNIVRCNKAVVKNLNLEFRDIVGKKCHEVFHSSKEPSHVCPAGRCMETLQTEVVEQNCLGGTFLMSCSPRLDSSGKFNGVVHIARDITEQKQSEMVLKESESKFRTLVDNIPGATYRCKNDENWTIEYISDVIESISGYPSSDFMNNSIRSLDSIIHQDDRSLVRNAVKEGIKNRRSFEMEYRIINKDANIIWVFERGTAVLDNNDKVLWLDGTIFDITARKEAEIKIIRQSKVLDEINKLFKLALTRTTERQLAEAFLSIAEEITESKFGFYGEINQKGFFDCLALSDPGWGACKIPETDAERLLKDMMIRGVDRSTMKEGKSRIINEPDSHPDKVGVPAGHPPITSFMGIPLKIAGTTIGMIGLANKEGGYDLDDQLSIETLSSVFVEILINTRAEKALYESEQKFRAIFENTFQFIGLLEPDGTLIEVNQGSLNFAAIKRSDVINKPLWEAPWWSHSESLQKLLYESVRKASEGNFIRFDATHVKHDGTLAYVDTSLTPVKDKDGNIIFIIKESRDITELKQTEERVHMLSQAVEQSPVTVVITDTKGNIEYVNRKFCESTGYHFSEVIGKNPRILNSGEKTDEEYRELWKTITSGNEWNGEFHNKKKSGELYWENASISAIRDKEGHIAHFLGVKEDITEKKISDQALQESKAKLAVSYKMASLGRLTAGIFHEILNPVNIISSHIQLLLMEAEKGSKTEDDLKSIQEEIQRIVKITDGLLRFSRIGTSEAEEVDLNDLLERTIAILEPDMKLESIRFVRSFADNLPYVIGSSDELRQVFLNLITNAGDSMMPDGGTITVKTCLVESEEMKIAGLGTKHPGLKKDFVMVTFEDTGCGLDNHQLDRIFEPFFTTKKEGQGTGLGLSLSYNIIENHSGDLHVESEKGKGTKFIISLPVKID